MDFNELKAAIIAALDLIAEYQQLGLKFTEKREPNSKGWIPCHALGREDKQPSAAINVNTGSYTDRGGEGMCLSLWDFAVRVGSFRTWREALTEYAKKAGLAKKLPKKWDGLRPDEKIDWCSAWNPLNVRGWLKKYSGATMEALLLVGSQQSRYPAKSQTPDYCLTWAAYGPELLDAPPRGFVLQRADGGDILLYQGDGVAARPTKRMVIGKSGLVGTHGLRLIQDGRAKLIIKTEGISDLIRLQAAIPAESRDEIAVITNAAGASEVDVPKEFAPLFAGLDVVLIHDADEPGQNGAKVWLGLIGKYAASVRNLDLGYAVEEKHGRDLRDWLGEHSFEELRALIDATLPFRADGATTAAVPSSEQHDDGPGVTGPTLSPMQSILKRLGIVVLGHDSNGRVTIFTERDGLVWSIGDISRYKLEHLIQNLGIDVVESQVNLSAEVDPAKLTLKQIRTAIASEANKHRIVDDKQLGPGCWELNGRLGVVGAGQALLWNGGLVRTSVPFAEDRLFDFGGEAWYEPDEIERLLKESLDEPDWCRKVFSDTESLFARWDNWRHTEDTPAIVTALLACTWVQTVWPIRPLVAVSGPTNCGKTIFLETITAVFGKLALACAKPSEAGIRQNIGHTAKVLVIDEFEADWHRSHVLELFRTTTRGQEIVRGDAGQRGRKFGLKHIPWVGAIELGLVEPADQNRFIVLELTERDKSRGSQLTVPNDSELRSLGSKLLVVAMRSWKAALGFLEPLRKFSFGSHDLRLVEIYSVPIAMIGAIFGWSLDEMRGALAGSLDRRSQTTEIDSTEQDLLSAIFDADVRLNSGRNETVGRMVSDNPSHEHSEALERHGIVAGLSEGASGEKVLHLNPATVRAKLLKGTKFAQMDIRQILNRINGSRETRPAINGQRARCVGVPMTTIETMSGVLKTF